MIERTLGPYQVREKIGEGGMGEVYRARDARLNRDVALKILPEAFARDGERVERFAREAQALAALNHPNIATIYGFVEAPPAPDGAAAGSSPPSFVHALAMEFVEGDDLSAVIARGPVPLADALPIARQIAEALEAAHEHAIVHRDLKPANIKVRPDGTVKVLDFGLAKALAPAAAAVPGAPSAWDLSNSPTVMSPMPTQAGIVLGTAAYMSPEQARGKSVDRRADIWAFGVVLWEMLAGRPLFAGETLSDTLSAVLRQDVDFSALPPDTPAGVRRLLARCLERDPRQRLRDIGEARIALAAPDAADADGLAPVVAVAPPRRRTWPWLAAIAATAVLSALAAWMLAAGLAAPAASVTAEGHFVVALPDEAPLVTLEIPGASEAPLVVSPDGRQIVYVGPNGAGSQLYVRALTDLTPRILPGTDGAQAPFFAPNGQWVGFFAHGKLKKVPLSGESSVTVADAADGRGGAWGTSGEIVFAPTDMSGLLVVPEAGGTPRALTRLDFSKGDDAHRWPQLLPGRRVLFTVHSWARETFDAVLVDIDGGARRVVLAGVDYARFVPDPSGSPTGRLVFVRRGALMAAPFDPSGAAPPGPATTVIEGVRTAQFDVSVSGVLVYTPGAGKPPDYSLVSVDRSGRARPMNELVRGYEDLHISPDGRLVALTVEESGPESPAQVWLADAARGTLTRATFEGLSRDPVWRPDGKFFAVGSKRAETTFGLYLHSLDGRTPPELLWASPDPVWPDPQSWTPDGRTLIFSTKGQETGDDIWTLAVGGTREAKPWLQTRAAEWAGRLSPDGRWMAYNSDESGRLEVYVQAFPGPGGKWLVSDGGGFNPIWSRDGRELFYRRGNQFLAAAVETEPAFTVGKSVALFAGRYRSTGRDFDVFPDGQRFVMMRNDEPRTSPSIGVLLNWWRALDARAAR